MTFKFPGYLRRTRKFRIFKKKSSLQLLESTLKSRGTTRIAVLWCSTTSLSRPKVLKNSSKLWKNSTRTRESTLTTIRMECSGIRGLWWRARRSWTMLCRSPLLLSTRTCSSPLCTIFLRRAWRRLRSTEDPWPTGRSCRMWGRETRRRIETPCSR